MSNFRVSNLHPEWSKLEPELEHVSYIVRVISKGKTGLVKEVSFSKSIPNLNYIARKKRECKVVGRTLVRIVVYKADFEMILVEKEWITKVIK